jgi:hypothetical protein
VLAFADSLGPSPWSVVDRVRARLRSLNTAAIVVSDEHAWCARPETSVVETYSRPGEITARVYGREPGKGACAVLVAVDSEGIVRFAHVGSSRSRELNDALAEALDAATRRLCAAHHPAKITACEWTTVSQVAGFVLAFLEGTGVRPMPAAMDWEHGRSPLPFPPPPAPMLSSHLASR